MRIFLAGATGAVGRRLLPLLVAEGHEVTGATRSAEKIPALAAAGARAAILDVFDARQVQMALLKARPEIVIHQLTDLPQVLDPANMAAALARNARLRIEATPVLLAAAKAAGARRCIAQSIAFAYAPGSEPHAESANLDVKEGPAGMTVRGVMALEQAVLGTPGIEGVVLRYGYLYGPGTWNEREPPRSVPLHVDAAAHAALLAVTRGAPGIYNIAEDDGTVAIGKARRELGFDPQFRLPSGTGG